MTTPETTPPRGQWYFVHVLAGWILVLGFMFGSLAYFLMVWRRAHRPA